MLDVSEITTTAPAFYAILPFTPIIGVLIFDGKWGPQLHIITILVICMLIASILEFLRSFNTQKVFSGLEVAYRGMADAFANVVMLLVAAGVFAQGLSTIGFIQSLISIATSFGSASIILMLVLVILTMLAAVTTGSGNAPFYAFVEMIPKLAHSSGINPAYLTIPMLQASNLGRTLSPVSGVVVAVAGMAKISPFESRKTHLGTGACWFGDCYRCYRADGARNGSSGHRQVNSNAGGKFPPALSCHPLWYMRCGLPTLP